MNKKYFFSIFLVLCLVLIQVAYACTDFQVKATDGTIVIGRSMEFAMGMDSEVVVIPRGEKIVSLDEKGNKGLSWTSKYGYLGVNALGEKTAILDGINEKGLTIGFLWFTESKYQTKKGDNWLAVTDLASWLLGNFATVEEVKEQIAKTPVVGVYVPQLNMVPGFHVAVHDANGKNIVIEFIDGKTNVYDNPIGVMTNKPTFDWQITNLRNYLNLDPYDRESKTIAGVKIDPTGSGTGWMGMPGDWSPPSRFVKTVHIVHSADPVKDSAGAVNLAEHVLNAVDIPLGVIREKNMTDKNMVDYTQWILIKDLTNKVLYFRSYQDLALKKVDMKKIDFSQGAKSKSVRIESGMRTIIDVTETMSP